MHWLFGFLFSLDVYLAQPRCRGENLGLYTGKGALPSLKIRGQYVEGVGGEGKEGRKWEFVLVFF